MSYHPQHTHMHVQTHTNALFIPHLHTHNHMPDMLREDISSNRVPSQTAAHNPGKTVMKEERPQLHVDWCAFTHMLLYVR